MGIAIRLFVIVAGSVTIAFLLAQVFRSARRLSIRIAEFKREQEELKKQGKIQNPYELMALLSDKEHRK